MKNYFTTENFTLLQKTLLQKTLLYYRKLYYMKIIFSIKLEPIESLIQHQNVLQIMYYIFLTYIQLYFGLNKANTSDKETSLLDLNIEDIGSDIHTSVYDKRDDVGIPIVYFPWLSGDVPRLPSYGITFRSWLDLLVVVLAFWIFILKISKLRQYC